VRLPSLLPHKSCTAFPSPKRILKSGDVVGLDFGVIYDCYYVIRQ